MPTVYEALFWVGAPQETKPFREEGADSKYTVYPGNGQSGMESKWPPYCSEEAPKEVTVCLAPNNGGQAPKWPQHTWAPFWVASRTHGTTWQGQDGVREGARAGSGWEDVPRGVGK